MEKSNLLLILLVLILSMPLLAFAVPFKPLRGDPNAARCGQGGFVIEQASRNATFQVFLTDDAGNRIDADGNPS